MLRHSIASMLLALLLTGCEGDPAVTTAASGAPSADAAPATTVDASPLVTVYKTPTCGCCTKWADYLEDQGFEVALHDIDDLGPIKDRLGVPRDLRSCHTATIGEHVIEGHVPVGDIQRFLETEDGGVLSVPGMPLGSPGMEHPSGSEAYESVLVRRDGTAEIFQHHAGD